MEASKKAINYKGKQKHMMGRDTKISFHFYLIFLFNFFNFYQPSKLFYQLHRSLRQRSGTSAIKSLIFYLRHLTCMKLTFLLYLRWDLWKGVLE